MTPEQLEELRSVSEEQPKIHIGLLNDLSNRTLLWGYTCDRADWHVYIRYREIHLYSYGGSEKVDNHICQEEYLPRDLVPDKRLYANACDFEFCKLLKTLGANLTFSAYSAGCEPSQYYGKIK